MSRIERDFPADLQIPAVLNMAALRREASQASVQLDTMRDKSANNQHLTSIYPQQTPQSVRV